MPPPAETHLVSTLADLGVDNLDVIEAYSGRNVFITGASGFVGMALLRKIFVSLPKAGKIFLLLRPNKKCPTPRDRFEDLLANDVFQNVNKQELLESDKVVAIKGDLRQPLLGIRDPDLQKLRHEFGDGVFIHCAADVKFDRNLNDAMLVNAYGATQCVRVAGLVDALCFVHISTLYVNSCEARDAQVYEKIYPQGFDPCAVYDEWEASGRKLSSERCYELRFNSHLSEQTVWPNTYTLTKNICENVVSRECSKLGLELSIARLGIVSPAYREEPGWFHGMGGFVFVLIGVATGNLKYVRGDGMGRPDYCPVDYSVNAVLAIGGKTIWTALYGMESSSDNGSISPASLLEFDESSSSSDSSSSSLWKRAEMDEKELEAREIRWDHVYNIGLCSNQPDDWNLYSAFQRGIPEFVKREIPRAVENPRFAYIKWDWLFYILYFLTYDLPFYFMYPLSYVSRRMARKVRWMGRGRQKLRMFYQDYTFFVNGRWKFDNFNVQELYNSLTEQSKRAFDFNRNSIDMEEYGLETSFLLMRRWDDHLKKKEEERKAFDKNKPNPLWNIVQVIFRLGVSLGGIGGISTSLWVWALVFGFAGVIFVIL